MAIINGNKIMFVQKKTAETDDNEQLAEISAALDNIIAKQEALISGTIIFRMQYNAAGIQDEFIAKRGMTWGEWVDSEYNRNPSRTNETLLYNDNGDTLLGTYCDENVYNSNNEIQTLWDVIVAGEHYFVGEREHFITFTLEYNATNRTEHIAIKGMTWAEWVDSEYNDAGLIIATLSNGQEEPRTPDGAYLEDSNGDNIYANVAIVDGETYHFA